MPSWRSSPSEKEQRQKQGHMVYTCGLFHSVVEKEVRLPRELNQNRHLTQEMSELLMSEKAKILCLESTHTGDTRITNCLYGWVPQNFTHLTCRLVSCCCWWAMVCFTNTLLMLCSMAYFFACEKRKVINCDILVQVTLLPLDRYYITCTQEARWLWGMRLRRTLEVHLLKVTL